MSCELHNFYTGTEEKVCSLVTHRQMKYTLIRVNIIYKRRPKASPGLNELKPESKRYKRKPT